MSNAKAFAVYVCQSSANTLRILTQILKSWLVITLK